MIMKHPCQKFFIHGHSITKSINHDFQMYASVQTLGELNTKYVQ